MMRRSSGSFADLAGRRVRPPTSLVVGALALVWALATANLTLFAAAGQGPRNIVPFHTIWNYLSDSNLPPQVRFRNLAGNLVMLAPLGASLAMLTRWRLTKVAEGAVAVSISIEVWQLLVATGRSVDVDDIILNLSGAVAGWLVGLLALQLLAAAAPSTVDPVDNEIIT